MAEENGQSTYVVQLLEDDDTTKEDRWRDVTRVTVPQRTRRKTILEKALGEKPVAGVYRVLDEESGRDMEVTLEEQPPRLRIA